MSETIVDVPGGLAIKADLFAMRAEQFPAAELAILDPPYGQILASEFDWDKVTDVRLARLLSDLFFRLSKAMPAGATAYLWGGIGGPGNRALYRTLLDVEGCGHWQAAEQITWKKKRGYGTAWRCLMNREECFRFVLGDIRKPLRYTVQYTETERGYAGFNAKYPAKSIYKRLTAIWDHASDMGQNKPHRCHKPAPLAKTQILSSSNLGDTVLDLFSGSGEVSLVARELDRKFVAYENGDLEFDKLVARLRK